MTWQSAPSNASAIPIDAAVVQELHEVRVPVEGVVDCPVDEAVLVVVDAIEALGQRLQALHVPAQIRDLTAVEHRGQVHVPVPLHGVDLTRQVRLGYQRQSFRHRSQSTSIQATSASAKRCSGWIGCPTKFTTPGDGWRLSLNCSASTTRPCGVHSARGAGYRSLRQRRA